MSDDTDTLADHLEIVAEVHPDGLTWRKAKFWLVWNKDGGAPLVAHYSEGKADLQAKKLARKHVGQTFIVLSATHKFKVVREPQEPAP